jgi:hypothetical protein
MGGKFNAATVNIRRRKKIGGKKQFESNRIEWLMYGVLISSIESITQDTCKSLASDSRFFLKKNRTQSYDFRFYSYDAGVVAD